MVARLHFLFRLTYYYIESGHRHTSKHYKKSFISTQTNNSNYKATRIQLKKPTTATTARRVARRRKQQTVEASTAGGGGRGVEQLLGEGGRSPTNTCLADGGQKQK